MSGRAPGPATGSGTKGATVDADPIERDRLDLVAAARRSRPAAVDRLPDSFRCDLDVDVDTLADEVDADSVRAWDGQRTASGARVVATEDRTWRVLALRSVGGDPDRTDAGGAEFGPIDWTPHSLRFPAITEFLRSLPLELAAVRLMALMPGGTSPEHVDTCVGLPWGRLRLHLPLRTTPDALVVFEDRPVHWDRHLWYGGFSVPHHIVNRGAETRIHLVIDGVPTAAFRELVPQRVRDGLHPDDMLVPDPVAPAESDDEVLPPGDLDVPAAFLNLAAPEHEYLGSTTIVRVRPRRVSRNVVGLTVSDGRRFVLLRTGPGEYRFLGWPHRGVTFRHTPSGPAVQLRSRVGSVRSSLAVPTITASP